MKIEVPEKIETAVDLHKVTSEVAHELIRYVKEQMGQTARKQMGPMMVPQFLTMDLLERIIYKLPAEALKIERFTGHARWAASGTYEILRPITKEEYMEALRKAQIIK